MSFKKFCYEESHYFSKDFDTNFDFLKKLIEDLSKETSEYDIVVKKRKIVGDYEINISQNSLSDVKSNNISIENIKNRHKNCPKLFGRAFFRLLLKDSRFKSQYLTDENLRKLAPAGINYPENIDEILENFTIVGFMSWLKSNNYHRVYNNLHFYREVWNYKEIEIESENNWIWQHYKYFLTQLMKEFFEVYAFEYVFKSKIHLKNGKKYLQLIPIFLRGIENPDTFTCLKFESFENGKKEEKGQNLENLLSDQMI